MLGLLTASGALLLSGCGGGAGAAPIGKTTNTNTNLNRIAFSSNRDGNFEIYTMNADGSDVQRVTTATGDDTKPAWSRDKTKLAFVSQRDGNAEIYVQNIADGKAVGAAQRITNDPAFDGAPSWNPDGTQLVIQSERDQDIALYVVNVASQSVRRLTQRKGFRDQNPAWSPKGDLIVFQSSEAPIAGQSYPNGIPIYLYTIGINGEGVQQIASAGFSSNQNPAWSPDGAKVTYATPRRIATFDLNSKVELFLIPSNQGGYFDPTYSPDGKQVVCAGYGKNFSPKANLYVLKADGSSTESTALLDDSSDNLDPSW